MSEKKVNPSERFRKVDRPFGQMVFYNFIGGIAWGLGVLIGTTIVFAIIAFLSKILLMFNKNTMI